ncbi:MAG TPA: TolC family outer membrane protein [Kiloniellaceae bacterium]|nr:TolC family outer membrane protein [Kiloniellaceae bacterium]
MLHNPLRAVLASWVVATTLATGLGLGLGQPAAAQSLEETLSLAYNANPTLRAARAELRAVNEGVPQALSNWRPEITLNGDLGAAYRDTKEPFRNKADGYPVGAQLNVIQPLYRGGRTVAGTERAEQQVLAQRAVLLTVEQDVLFAAATAYLNVWRDQSILQLNVKNEQVLARQLEAAQDRFEVGEVTRTDVAQSESRLARATAERIAAEGALASSRANFQRVVGRYPELLEQPAPVVDLPTELDPLIEMSLREDPRVLQSIYSERAAEKSVRVAEGSLLPTLQLRGTLQHQDELHDSDNTFQEAQILAELSVPFYQQGVVSSQVRQAKQTASQRRIEVDAARVRAREDAIRAWESHQTAKAQIESFKAEVRATEIALEGVRQENLVGSRTILDVLDAEQEVLDAQVSLVASQRDELVAAYAVRQAVGRLTAAALGLDVPIYNPDRNYEAVRNRWYGLDATE